MSIFTGIKPEDLLWIYRFGRPKRKISTEVLLADLSVLETPVFFLSTGRCGTKWFNMLLSKDKSVRDFHSPYPNLSLQNKYMHSLWTNPYDQEQIEVGSQIFLSAREQHLRFSYKCKKRYFETNNHITFFAPVIAQLMPQAKFVHLYRHPGEFVRSGIRRGWYAENSQANAKLIEPKQNPEEWKNFTQIEKISWLWNESNTFIENFMDSIESDRAMGFNFNNLNKESLEPLLDFMKVSLSMRELKKLLQSRLNVQQAGTFPKYEQWTKEQKSQMIKICGSLAEKYGYQL